MGNLRVCFAIATLAACGSESKQPDAGITLVDSPMPDAKVWNDAPPKNYDLTCLGGTLPTTAPGTISVSGTTQEFGGGGGSALGGVSLAVFKRNDTATSLANGSSDTAAATLGEFALTNIATGGAPLDGYIEAFVPRVGANPATHRKTLMFPPNVVDANLSDVPVIIISNDTFNTYFSSAGQNDASNGVLLFFVTDCSNAPMAEATVNVEQNGSSQGQTIHLGSLMSALAGTFISFNVPHGETDIKVSYNGMSFPTKKVLAVEKANGAGEPGTVSFTAVRPGP
jgi:hypothetical protein